MHDILIAATFVAALACSRAALSADELDQIVIHGRRMVADETLTRQVAAALRDDPYVLDTHITVTVAHGVVTLHGIALDYLDVTKMQRLTRKIAGVRRVVDDIDVRLGGE